MGDDSVVLELSRVSSRDVCILGEKWNLVSNMLLFIFTAVNGISTILNTHWPFLNSGA